MQKPLAIAVIGGLAVSVFFTLLVAPVLYVTLEKYRPSRHDDWDEMPDEKDAIA